MASDTRSIQAVFLYRLREYHENRFIWHPVVNELLCVQHEENNRYDQYATAAIKQLPSFLTESLVGHLRDLQTNNSFTFCKVQEFQ